MPAVQRFRSALGGFNRNDVVQYIEYLTNHYQSQIQQLTNQLENAKAAPSDSELQAQLDAALARCAELEKKLAQTGSEAAELEAYRRAEKTERLAKDRAQQIYEKAEEVATQISTAADQAAAQMQACEQAVQDAKGTLQETVNALYAVRPEEM